MNINFSQWEGYADDIDSTLAHVSSKIDKFNMININTEMVLATDRVAKAIDDFTDFTDEDKLDGIFGIL